jgi:hypothetical protein
MEESLIMKKLENVDRELHSLMDNLKTSREKPAMTLKELQRLMKSSVKCDVDTTKLIRKMREKKYDL